MHVIPHDMVCCQPSPCLLTRWNPARCLSEKLERGINCNSQRVPKNVSKGGSTVSGVSHLVYFALFLPTCRAKTPNSMEIAFLLNKEKETLLYQWRCALPVTSSGLLDASLKRGRGNKPWENYMLCPQKLAAFSSFSLLANTPVAVKLHCFRRPVFI